MGNKISNPTNIFTNKFIYPINIPFKKQKFFFHKNIDLEKKNVVVTISIGKDKIEIRNKNIKQMYIEFKNKEAGDIMTRRQIIWDLDLSYNIIGTFSYNKERISIYSLDLSNNKVTDNKLELNDIYIFNSKKINLSSNSIQLKNINTFFNDENIPYFQNIEELDLTDNRIKTGTFINLLDKLIEYKDKLSLKKINICNNPIKLDENIVEKKKQLQNVEILMGYDTNKMNKIIKKIHQLEKIDKKYKLKIDSFTLNFVTNYDIEIIIKTNDNKKYDKIIYNNKLMIGKILNHYKLKSVPPIYPYKFEENIFFLESIENLEIIVNDVIQTKKDYEIVELFRCSMKQNDLKKEEVNPLKDSIFSILNDRISKNIFYFKKEYDLPANGIIEGSIEELDLTQNREDTIQ